MSARTFLDGFKRKDVSDVNLQTGADEGAEFLLAIFFCPFVEIHGVLVVIVQHLFQDVGVVSVAIGIFYRRKVGVWGVFPTVLVFVGASAAALAKTCVADFAVIGEDLAACGIDGLLYLRGYSSCDALVSLAVVVGTDVEDGVVFAVVPSYQFGVGTCEGEEVMPFECEFLAFLHLGIEPAAADDGGSLEEFEAAGVLHLTADDAGEVFFDGDAVDGM